MQRNHMFFYGIQVLVIGSLWGAGCNSERGDQAAADGKGEGSQPVSSMESLGSGGDTEGVSPGRSSRPSRSTESADTDGFRFDLGSPNTGMLPILECDALDASAPTSVGCEFWAVDLLTSEPPFDSFGISVGNPWSIPVYVQLQDMRGPGDTLRTVMELELNPQESQLLRVNGTDGLLPGQHNVFPGTNFRAAFRVTSSHPVTAMQINPVGGAGSFLPEASLLIPTNGLGTSYRALGYDPGLHGGGRIIIIATEDGTRIQVDGEEAVLNAFDVYTRYVNDATGELVTATKPVAVISGGDCIDVPEDQNWCDHIEEQVIPLAAWGTRYVGARHPQRAPDLHPDLEEVYWRVVAAVENTEVTLTPAVLGVGSVIQLANAGDYVEFSTAESFVAQSDAETPFMLVQYMSGGSNIFDPPGLDCRLGDTSPQIGDPWMVQMVPVEQWISDVPFLTDMSYPSDFVVIAREKGTAVNLACFGPIPDSRFSEIPGTDFEVAEIELDIDAQGGEAACRDGQQFVSGDGPLGVYVGGVDCAASYGYPAGLDFAVLWAPPVG